MVEVQVTKDLHLACMLHTKEWDAYAFAQGKLSVNEVTPGAHCLCACWGRARGSSDTNLLYRL